MNLLRGLVAAAALGAAGPLAAADPSPLRMLTTADESRGWEAVGKLTLGPGQFCTAALIAPDLVLTAAHCLFDPRSLDRTDPAQYRFAAGFRDGRALAERGIKRALVDAEYVYEGPTRLNTTAHDLALLQLDRPIRQTRIRPFETRPRPRKGAELGVVSYAQNRADRPALQELCHVLARRSGMLVMSCDVDFGASGAPVFIVEDGRPYVVSVVSARAEISGQLVSLGTSLEAPLNALRARMASGDGRFITAGPLPVRRLPQVGVGRGQVSGQGQGQRLGQRLGEGGGVGQGSGAKFLKP